MNTKPNLEQLATPRTNAIVHPFIGNMDASNLIERDALLDHARQLERELAEARRELDAAIARLDEYVEKTEHFRAALAEAQKDKARLDWLLGRSTFGAHVLEHKHQTHVSFEPFFTLRIQVYGREAIDDAMQNKDAIAAIDAAMTPQKEDAR